MWIGAVDGLRINQTVYDFEAAWVSELVAPTEQGVGREASPAVWWRWIRSMPTSLASAVTLRSDTRRSLGQAQASVIQIPQVVIRDSEEG